MRSQPSAAPSPILHCGLCRRKGAGRGFHRGWIASLRSVPLLPCGWVSTPCATPWWLPAPGFAEVNGGVAHVVQLFKSHSGSQEVVLASLRFLERVAFHGGDVQGLCALGAIPMVVAGMAAFQSALALQVRCACVWWSRAFVSVLTPVVAD